MDVEQSELGIKGSLAPGSIQYSWLEEHCADLDFLCQPITPEFKCADTITLGGCCSRGRRGWQVEPHLVCRSHVRSGPVPVYLFCTVGQSGDVGFYQIINGSIGLRLL